MSIGSMQTTEAELRALMGAALDGDQRAYRALLSDLRVRLTAFFARRVGAADGHVDDLVQEALIAIHSRRETWDRTQALSPWVYAIARYKLVDHFRRTGRRPTAPLEDAGAALAVEGDAAAVEARRDVETALAQLPARAGQLVRALKIEDISVSEAAVRFGMSEGAVKVASHRALKRLSKLFGAGDAADE
jgi:RNA polymerase sigma-70 factor (ECF subfamily)